MPKLLSWLFIIYFLLLSGLSAQEKDIETLRQNFLRAEYALKKNDYTSFNRLAAQLVDYPLYPYLIYDHLKQQINHVSQTEKLAGPILEFEQHYPDFPYLKALRRMWLYKLGKTKKWSSFVANYKPLQDEGLACYNLYAQYQIHQRIQSLDGVLDLWSVGYSQPEECNAVFALAQEKGIIGSEAILKRYQLSLIEKNFDLSHHLIKKVDKTLKEKLTNWERLIKNPYLIFKPEFMITFHKDSNSLDILTHAIQIIAKREPEKALKWWQQNELITHFSSRQKMHIERDIAMYLAHQRSTLASDFLHGLPDTALDNTCKEWRIRLALLEENWDDVLKWISHLSPEKQKEREWQYWTARAHAELNHSQTANPLFTALARERNYYGFLASLKLNKPISLQHHVFNISKETTLAVQQRPAIKRFYELIALKKEAKARVEWFRTVEKMTEEEIIAAAKIVQKLKLPDVAIFTMSKAKFKDDVNLRFPLAFYTEVINRANEHNIDPAWVFAIARQESAFHNEAISNRGAVGVLQLLPSTAKHMAKKYDITYPSDASLIEPDKNIQIGSVYLKELKQRMYNNTILATASYNAGPTRIQGWLPDKTLDADIWIETIPYRETREYVKNVLAFMSIYRMQLGYPASFAMIMKPISTG